MELTRRAKLPVEPRFGDVRTVNFGNEKYNIVLMNDLLCYLPGKEDAYKVVDKAIAATKTGGYIWIKTVGDVTEEARDPENSLQFFGNFTGSEELLAFGQTELLQYLCEKDLRIIHSQLVPQKGFPNIMYGEDWVNPKPDMLYSSISILAQKR